MLSDGISVHQTFKIFLGEHAPRPPYMLGGYQYAAQAVPLAHPCLHPCTLAPPIQNWFLLHCGVIRIVGFEKAQQMNNKVEVVLRSYTKIEDSNVKFKMQDSDSKTLGSEVI